MALTGRSLSGYLTLWCARMMLADVMPLGFGEAAPSAGHEPEHSSDQRNAEQRHGDHRAGTGAIPWIDRWSNLEFLHRLLGLFLFLLRLALSLGLGRGDRSRGSGLYLGAVLVLLSFRIGNLRQVLIAHVG